MAMNGGTWFGGVFNSLALLVKNKKKKREIMFGLFKDVY